MDGRGLVVMRGGSLDGRLVAAVRAGDESAVRALLGEGADPDTGGPDGLPVLCAAVGAYDSAVADALVDGGADPDRVLPDGTTPLWRAVDGGSPAVAAAVLGREPRLRLPAKTRERLLDLARSWHETGAAEELRRRTGASGPAETVRVPDDADAYQRIDQVSLGGLVVRDGHAGILTALEWAFRVLTPVDELIARAAHRPDEDDATWWQVTLVLLHRRSFATWSAVVAHRHHPDLAHRRFVADFLRTRGVVVHDSPYADAEGDFLSAWAEEETDPGMLAKVLDAFGEYEHPGLEAAGLRHAGHPDVRVRQQVPALLHPGEGTLTPPGRAALLALVRDPDATVRFQACRVAVGDDPLLGPAVRALLMLAEDPDAGLRGEAAVLLASCRDRTPAVADALFALLDEDDQITRLEAAYGLALRDDPRTADAVERVGPLGDGFEEDHRWSRLWQWKWDKEHPASG
ncbi:ankyrin repeat domain-containing protein [Streptomyces sp. NPDC048219]|uniref:ankyrin repeat domain-containing protein n=1 Tax=unclassified Streptomyces TaxID=2593676 RepID=UPI003434F6E7